MTFNYQDILQYMTKPLADRQRHLDLAVACLEIGGDSQEFRGTLSFYLKTTIPRGMKIHLCHACNNPRCGNPNHLYWGTAGENLRDAINAGRRSSIAKSHIAKLVENGQRNKIFLKSGKGTVWVTNGNADHRVEPMHIPDGFVRGRKRPRSSVERASRS